MTHFSASSLTGSSLTASPAIRTLTARFLAASPGRIHLSVGAQFLRAAMHVVDARLSLVDTLQRVDGRRHPCFAGVGHRILRNHFEVSRLYQIVQRLRSLFLIHRVGVDGIAQHVQVFFEHGFLGILDGRDIAGNGNGRQHTDDQHHDHQLHQRKSAFPRRIVSRPSHVYQSLYFVPSSAMPSDFEYTSKTLWPPKESLVGSSCIDRIPHSFLPVIGSTGIRRRNRTFLPCTSTPSTSVCKSG